MNLINRGGYLHEKYRVPPQLIEGLLGAVTREVPLARGVVRPPALPPQPRPPPSPPGGSGP